MLVVFVQPRGHSSSSKWNLKSLHRTVKVAVTETERRSWCRHTDGFITDEKRLTSTYLFTSRHQTHSSVLSDWPQKWLCEAERRRPISSRNKARAFSPPRPLFFIIYRGSVPRQRRRPREQRPSQLGLTMDSGARGGCGHVTVKDGAGAARRRAEGHRVKTEGGRENGKK